MPYDYLTEHDSPNYTPADECPEVFGRPRTVDSITIHWWGDPANEPQFDGIVHELCRPHNGQKSAHHIAEAGRVACIVDPDDAAWSTGDSRGNASTIAIECNPRAWDADYETIAELIADTRDYYGDLPLRPHHYWVATECPGDYDLDRLDRMADHLAGGNHDDPPKHHQPAPDPDPEPEARPVLSLGDTGPAVRSLQRFMLRVFPAYADPIRASGGIDGSYGYHTQAVMREFQRRAKRAGVYHDAVDGITGPHTWAALARYGYDK